MTPGSPDASRGHPEPYRDPGDTDTKAFTGPGIRCLGFKGLRLRVMPRPRQGG
ncbi:hypothetical protein ACP4J0_06310 [Streptomyces sp. WG7]